MLIGQKGAVKRFCKAYKHLSRLGSASDSFGWPLTYFQSFGLLGNYTLFAYGFISLVCTIAIFTSRIDYSSSRYNIRFELGFS
jgi:hypothetical protein